MAVPLPPDKDKEVTELTVMFVSPNEKEGAPVIRRLDRCKYHSFWSVKSVPVIVMIMAKAKSTASSLLDGLLDTIDTRFLYLHLLPISSHRRLICQHLIRQHHQY